MTTHESVAQKGRHAAAALKDLLRQLFDISNRQGDALSREDYDSLEGLLTEKDRLLVELDKVANELKTVGMDLHNPFTYPKDSLTAAALREAADLSRKLQAHERYLLGQMIAQQQWVGDRMNTLTQKRMAMTGYKGTRHHGRTVDTLR